MSRFFSTCRGRSRLPSRRLFLEPLENRTLLATITVTTTADDVTPNDGTVSLREAITAINAGNAAGYPEISLQNPGTFGTNDTINFNLPSGGRQVIAVGTSPSAQNTPLPQVSK